MSFDPDAYLASKGGGFDPDAYLAQKGPTPETIGPGSDMSAARADVGDTLSAAARGAQKVLSLGHRVGGAAAGMAALYSGKEFTPAYDAYRKEAAAEDAGPAQAHPVASAVGGMLPALLVPGAGYSSLPRALATGAGLGAEQAVSDAPDLTAPGAVGDVAKGAATGAAFSGAGYGVAKAAPIIAEKLTDTARAAAKRVLSGGGAPMNAGKKALSNAAADAALEHGIQPFGTTAGTAERLQDAREVLGDQYGKIVSYLEGQGITGPQQQAVLQELAAQRAAVNAGSMNPAVPKVYDTAAEQIAGKPAVNGNLGLGQTESLKQSAQGMAKSAYAKLEPGELGEAHEDVAAILRKANEDAIDAGAAASNDPATQAIAAQFRPVKAELGPVIEASRSANNAAAKASKAAAISPRDILGAVIGGSTGGLGGAAQLGLVSRLLRTRGPSTVAWGSHQLAEKVAVLAKVNPAALGKYGGVLAAALNAGGQDSLAANLYVIGQTDPEGSDALRKSLESQ